MYIAFKWLVGLTLLMWFLVCGIDVFIKTLKKGKATGILLKEVEGIFKNESSPIKSTPKKGVVLNKFGRTKNQRIYGILHLTVFSAAGFLILIITKKKDLLQITKKINSFDSSAFYKYLIYLKHQLIIRRDTIFNYFSHAWRDMRKRNKPVISNTLNDESVNHVKYSNLLKKLNDVSNEKNSLSLLLAASIFENRNIKYNYKLESMAKKRLEQYTEENEKKTKDALSEKKHFQHLYLISYEENIELRATVQKLTELRDHAERSLISLVHEICMSRNEKLMAYCSQFVVQTKEHLLRTDMRAEIRQFLRSTNPIAQFTSHQPTEVETLSTKSLVSQGCNTLIPAASDTPLLSNFDSEHIWAVKNDDGLIEKLYEYDFTTDLHKGTVRRIREYSVYHHKDCYYKNSKSWTRIYDNYSCENFTQELEKFKSCNKIKNHRFLTGSEAFRNFLQNYRRIHLAPSHKIPITYM